MRVVQVAPDIGPGGGAERMVLDLAEGLTAMGINSVLVSLFDPPAGSIRESVGYTLSLHKKLGPDLRMPGSLRSILTELRPDVVHTHRSVWKYLIAYGLTHPDVSYVHTLHNVARHEADRPSQAIQQWLFRSGRVVPVGVAQGVADSAAARYGLQRVDVVRNGIDVARFQDVPEADRLRVREELGLRDGEILVVSAGRLVHAKGHQLLLRAASQTIRQGFVLHVAIAGDGPLRGSLHEEARSLGIAREVHLLGFRSDLPAILAAADIFALPSRWEGHPLVALEAMAAGRPVLATSVGGVAEIVDDGLNGTLVPAEDQRRFARGLQALTGDVELRGRMGRAAAEKARRFFGTKGMVEEYVALYERVVAKLVTRRRRP